MTQKQIAVTEFYAALEQYKTALASRCGLVVASIRIQAALGGVPKSYKRLVNQAFANPA